MLACLAVGLGVFAPATPAYAAPLSATPSPQQVESSITLQGQIVDGNGQPLGRAHIALIAPGEQTSLTTADATGHFSLQVRTQPHYILRAEAEDGRSSMATLDAQAAMHELRIVITRPTAPQPVTPKPVAAAQALEFSDKPSFTVAGVTDWTAVGGHGADTTLRASEALAHGATALDPPLDAQRERATHGDDAAEEAKLRADLAANPDSLTAKRALGTFYLHAGNFAQALPPLRAASTQTHAAADDELALAKACRGLGDLAEARMHASQALLKSDRAEIHRLLGEVDESLEDSLSSVREFERAAQMDPSEENYFAWGSELLKHRAIWEALAVFDKGSHLHPRSSRLQAGSGAALFAGARYQEAAERLCAASDLAREDPELYLLIGRAAIAAPSATPCVRPKLEGFLKQQPKQAEAHYNLAMLMLTHGDSTDQGRALTLLKQATLLDPTFARAYLQLGILAFRERHYPEAIHLYRQAIEADAKLAEAHFRLAVAYDRTGQGTAAQQEFALHEQLAKADADDVEQQRKQVKQFLVTAQSTPQPAPDSGQAKP